MTMYRSVFTLRPISTKLILLIILMAGITTNNAQNQVTVAPAVKMAVSQAMRDLPLSTGTEKSAWKDGIVPLRRTV